MADIVAFIEARLAEDELWALEASRRDESAPVAGGAHWQWETNHDQVLTIDPLTTTYIGDHAEGEYVSLRSVEEFPTSVGSLPQFAISVAHEVPVCVGGHIARHDPARVLAEIAAKRAIVADYQIVRANNAIEKANDGDEVRAAARDLIAKSLRMVLRRLASVWSAHPDYDPAWRIDG